MGFPDALLFELEQVKDSSSFYISVTQAWGYDDERLSREIDEVENNLRLKPEHFPEKTIDDKLTYATRAMQRVLNGQTEGMSEDEIRRVRIEMERMKAGMDPERERNFREMYEAASKSFDEERFDFHESMDGARETELEQDENNRTYRLVKDLMVLTRAEKGLI